MQVILGFNHCKVFKAKKQKTKNKKQKPIIGFVLSHFKPLKFSILLSHDLIAVCWEAKRRKKKRKGKKSHKDKIKTFISFKILLRDSNTHVPQLSAGAKRLHWRVWALFSRTTRPCID